MLNRCRSLSRSMLILLALCLATGCGGGERDRRVAVPADGDLPARVLGTPRFAQPIFPADSPVVIIPFGVEVDAARLQRHVAATRVESPGGGETARAERMHAMRVAESEAALSMAGVEGAAVAGGVAAPASSTWPGYEWMTWNNVLLFNADTGESRLLLGRRAVITRFIYPQAAPRVWHEGRWVEAGGAESPYPPSQTPVWPRDLLLLGVATRDTNRDGIIDADDAAAGYAASLEGGAQTLTRVTPEGLAWLEVLHPADEPRLYLVAADDADGDLSFGSEGDERYYFAVDKSPPFTSTPMTPGDLRQRAMEIVRGR